MTTAEDGAQGWSGRVSFTPGGEPIAYRPREIIILDTEASRNRLLRTVRTNGRQPSGDEITFEAPRAGERREGNPVAAYVVARNVADPQVVVQQLRTAGVDAQLNHVLFAHCGTGCCEPHPAAAAGVTGSPVYATPVYATPVYATPVYATPVYATPVYATPVYATGHEKATGLRRSSARCVGAAEAAEARARLETVAQFAAGGDADVVIIDTGEPQQGFDPGPQGMQNPGSDPTDRPDADADDRLDPCAGHGRFIQGLVKQLAPAAGVVVRQAIEPEGDGDEASIAALIGDLPDAPERGAILNLSFGGYVLDTDGLLLAKAIADLQARGWVVVASAGNDGTCRRTYPAALPGVISVGAIGPHGPAPFTNYGPWVRACAPGVDLVSTFLGEFDGDSETGPLTGWVRWSGTSFSAPVVTGALIQEAIVRGITVQEAVRRIIDAEGLLRLHNLGTVVNRL